MIRLLMLTAPMDSSKTSAERAKRGAGAAGLRITHIKELPATHRPSRTRAVLTPRQTQVLREMTLGHSTKEIARQLRISVKTAETHRAQLIRRLRINHIPGLVRYALHSGVVPVAWLFAESSDRTGSRKLRR